MNTITKNKENSIIIKKSKFIAKIYNIEDEKNAKNIIDKIKNEYKDANHHCYAYITNSYKKSFDDKEPNKTAGIPILSILEKYNLNNTLCIVIRYFGGIKLGTGGLIRAYKKATEEVIKISKICQLKTIHEMKIEFNLNNIKNLNYFLLKNKIEISKKYLSNNGIYIIKVNPDLYNTVKLYLKNSNIILLNEKKSKIKIEDI